MNLFAWIRFVIGGVVGSLCVFGIEELRASWRVDTAVSLERANQVQICNARVAEVGSDINADSLKGFIEAKATADAIPPTPTDKADLRSLCNTDSACRDRQAKK